MTAIVYTSCAAMPSSCKGQYRHVYVLDVPYWLANQKDYRPSSIRAKEVKTVIGHWGPRSVGKTERCSYRKAIAAAEEVARQFNAAGDMAEAEQLIGAGGSA